VQNFPTLHLPDKCTHTYSFDLHKNNNEKHSTCTLHKTSKGTQRARARAHTHKHTHTHIYIYMKHIYDMNGKEQDCYGS